MTCAVIEFIIAGFSFVLKQGFLSKGVMTLRRIALVIAPLLLVGCSSQRAAEAAEAEPTEMKQDVAGVTANGSPSGTYDVTDKNGNVTSTVLNADGSYKDLAANGTLLVEGTWAVTDYKTCFTPTTEGAQGGCFRENIPNEDRSFKATGDDGTVVTVKLMRDK